MSISIDLTDDFAQIVDGLVAVDLVRPNGERTSLPAALRGPVQEPDPDSTLGFASATWSFATDNDPPRAGDRLVAGENSWWITAVQQARQGGVARCDALREDASRLPTLVVIEEAVVEADTIVGWREVRAAVRARVQLVATNADHSAVPGSSTDSYRLETLEDLPLNHLHRVRTPDGEVYQIESYTPPVAASEPAVAVLSLVEDP